MLKLSLEYPVSAIARVFNMSRSRVYHILNQREKPMNKVERMREKYGYLKYKFDSLCREFPKYGYRRIRVMLRRRYEIYMSKKTVQWIMRAFNLGLPVNKKRVARPHSEKMEVTHPYQLWQTDMTKVWVNGTGWMYLFGVIDCFTREVMGFCFSLFASAKEALRALEMAVDTCFSNGIPDELGLILNSDNGCQFGARAFQSAVKAFGFTFTRTAYDTPQENAYIESFFGKFKEEEVWLKEYESVQEAEESVRKWIYKYNYERIHSSLGYLTPVEFKEKWFSEHQSKVNCGQRLQDKVLIQI